MGDGDHVLLWLDGELTGVHHGEGGKVSQEQKQNIPKQNAMIQRIKLPHSRATEITLPDSYTMLSFSTLQTRDSLSKCPSLVIPAA